MRRRSHFQGSLLSEHLSHWMLTASCLCCQPCWAISNRRVEDWVCLAHSHIKYGPGTVLSSNTQYLFVEERKKRKEWTSHVPSRQGNVCPLHTLSSPFIERNTPPGFRMVCTMPFFLPLAKGPWCLLCRLKVHSHSFAPTGGTPNSRSGWSFTLIPHKLQRQHEDLFFHSSI